ncbi:MAG: metallophosphoesterase family protein [Oligoflexus sp.]
MKILQISDLHFGPPFVEKVGLAVLEFAAKSQADVIVITGDLTQRAKPYQFRQAKIFIDQLSKIAQTVTVIGNHDIPLFRVVERLWRPYRLYQSFISRNLDFYVDVHDMRIVGLNSTHPYRKIKNGYLSPGQIKKCQQFFSAPGAEKIQTRILAMHHHLVPVPSFGHQEVLPQAPKLLEQLNALDVHMVLSGHIHRSFIGNSLDIYAGEKRDKGILIVSSGTTTSRRGRGAEQEKNTLNVVDIRKDDILISHFMYFSAANSFQVISKHSYQRYALRLEDNVQH